MEEIVFVDTCIFIDYLKGNKKIQKRIASIGFENIYLSSIILMEIYQGTRNKRELQNTKKRLIKFSLLKLNQDIFSLATTLMEEYTLSHSLKLPDAIIAATCLIYDIRLYTYNLKDFDFIPNIKFYGQL